MSFTRLILATFILIAMCGQAKAGSIIIDGTDANEHGFASNGANHEGWLYMQKVLEALAARVPPGAAHVVVDLTTGPGTAREAIQSAFDLSSLPPKWRLIHMNSKEAMDEWLKNLSITNTGILCIPTFGLTSGDLTAEEMLIINNHAADIARFVTGAETQGRGGAVFALGETGNGAWQWLRTLFPGIIVRDFSPEGISSRLEKTDITDSILLDLPDADLAAINPWHNSFEGDLTGFQVLATALTPSENPSRTRRNVILGTELINDPSAKADLSITSSISQGPFPVGSTITYTILVTNNGPDTATAVTVRENLPAGTSLISCLPIGICSGQDNSQTAFLGSLSAGMTITLTYTVGISCSIPINTELTHSASVTSSTPDPKPVNNMTEVMTKVTPSLVVNPAKSILVFGPVKARSLPKKKAVSDSFTIENTSKCSLDVRFDSITRIGTDVASGKITNPNSGDCGLNEGKANPGDCKFFSTTFSVGSKEGSTIVLSAGEKKEVVVFFRPVIPPFIEASTGLPSDLVLPHEFTSNLNLTVSGTSRLTIMLVGRVTPIVNLINPTVTMTRSGDEFIVDFTVYDSDPADLKGVQYEFLDKAGKVKKTFLADTQEFSQAIQEALGKGQLIRGQSFKVRQRFSNANSHPEYRSARITVSGNTSSATASSAVTSGAQSLEKKQGRAVILPNLSLLHSRQKRLRIKHD